MSPAQENLYLKLVLALFFLAFMWLVFAPNTGFVTLLRQRNELKSLEQEIQTLTLQNKVLKQDIEKIKTDPVFLEFIARKNHNLVKSNEMVFEFPSKKKKKQE